MQTEILYVENDKDLNEIITLSLRAEGYIVTPVPDGEDACAFLTERDPANTVVLITDLGMPQLNGVELLELVLANKWPVRGIVVTSALPSCDPRYQRAKAILASQAKGALPCCFLDKPISPHILYDAISSVV